MELLRAVVRDCLQECVTDVIQGGVVSTSTYTPASEDESELPDGILLNSDGEAILNSDGSYIYIA